MGKMLTIEDGPISNRITNQQEKSKGLYCTLLKTPRIWFKHRYLGIYYSSLKKLPHGKLEALKFECNNTMNSRSRVAKSMVSVRSLLTAKGIKFFSFCLDRPYVPCSIYAHRIVMGRGHLNMIP